jgi:hypothetical protein
LRRSSVYVVPCEIQSLTPGSYSHSAIVAQPHTRECHHVPSLLFPASDACGGRVQKRPLRPAPPGRAV